ncbi:ABC transporter permease [Tepidamorphus sp. 3E244]|uniref:ABC transporter permease n=1 Tax=Tepidamorphus sp. 3E244 TaxID=3385498 RepID=UPI0038FCBF6B
MSDLTADGAMTGPLIAADGTPLKKKLAQTTRRAKIRALLLTAPLVAFLLIGFVFPIGQMLYRSLHNPAVSKVLPNLAEALKDWDGEGVPGEEIFAIAVADLKQAREDRTIGQAATRVNYDLPGSRSLFTSSARKVNRIEGPPYKEQLIELDKDWDNPELWAILKRVSNDYTAAFYLSALDRRYNAEGEIVMEADYQQIYVKLFMRTFWMSMLITFLCFLLAFPVSYLLSVLPLRTSNLLMILVLLPFWTSLLVRTTAWIAMLQSEGVVNDILVTVGLVADENRAQLIYNQTGTIIAMTHILLPFMILPLYSVMKTIPPSLMRAARSLGANSFTAFRRVYFPQTVPGIAAGTLLVFILSIGFYITPALVGGQDGQMISNLIAFHMQSSLNWSLAAALGGILLASVLVLYWLYNRLIGVDNLKFG